MAKRKCSDDKRRNNKAKRKSSSSSSSFYSESKRSNSSSSSEREQRDRRVHKKHSKKDKERRRDSKHKDNNKNKRDKKGKEKKNRKKSSIDVDNKLISKSDKTDIKNIDQKQLSTPLREENNIDNQNEITPKIVKNEDNFVNLEASSLNFEMTESSKFEGIELRSRMINQGEENIKEIDALEIFSTFKKINYLEIPNVHRKLIVYNLPPDVNVDEIKQYFLTLLSTLNPNMKLSNPILNIETIFTENGQYYIFDLATKDDIEILKAMNNTEWRAYRMRIEKPASFFREFNATQGRNAELKVIKKQGFLTESDNKLYMGGIPTSAKENEIREIVESFGQLKSFNLVKDPNSEEELNRGFCFFEYVDEKVTDRAVKGLHNREMGEKRLKVQRANINCKSFTIAQQIKNTPVDMTPREQGKSNFSDAIITEENIIQLDIPIYSSIPSRVVQLINLVTAEDIMDDADYREIIEDIRNECNQFGTVLNVEIPRPDKTTSLASNAVGKTFVKFSTLPSAKKARYNLSGRKFNRKTVIASFYPENYFDVREFNYQS